LAPQSDDLKRVLSLSDFSHLKRKQLDKMGIWPRRPEYSSGVYNNKMNLISEASKNLFEFRNKREAVSIKETFNYLLKVNGITKEFVRIE
jgi:endonuclease III-like uncharacterized protein